MQGDRLRLVDHMGGDHSVVNAARVSYGNGSKGEKADRRLIRFLLRNKHTSPFEHVVFTFHVKAPIFVARQWMRHRTWSFNELSYRYTEPSYDFFVPETWRRQADDNRQSSEGTINNDERARTLQWRVNNEAMETYLELLDLGVAREQARLVLPVSLFTQFYGTVDLHNLLHFLELRTDEHAQQEIQDYANGILNIIRPIVPWTIEAWEELRSDS